MGTTAPQPPPKLVLKDQAAFLEYIEGINLALGRAINAKHYDEPTLGMPAVRSLVFVDLADVEEQPIPDTNYTLLFQGVSSRKLAYAIVNESPGFAGEVLDALAILLTQLDHGDIIPRDHTND